MQSILERQELFVHFENRLHGNLQNHLFAAFLFSMPFTLRKPLFKLNCGDKIKMKVLSDTSPNDVMILFVEVLFYYCIWNDQLLHLSKWYLHLATKVYNVHIEGDMKIKYSWIVVSYAMTVGKRCNLILKIFFIFLQL